MITGSCLCGTVRWQFDEMPSGMTHCYCSMCRKAHGTSFATYLIAPRAGFSFNTGKDAITVYASSEHLPRAFCNECGSMVPAPKGSDQIGIPAGGLDDDPGIRPTAHIFVPSKAPWVEINDDLKQFDAFPGQDKEPEIARAPLDPAKEGVLRGSCLCGDVAYEITGPIKAVHNCHCSRCRKGRAAACATNGFTGIDGVTFTRGLDNLKAFKLPEAKFFTQVFCTRCGSKMPRLDEGRGIAVIPFGSLDDDPGCSAEDHVFVGSKAVWDTITDNLPQFDGMPG